MKRKEKNNENGPSGSKGHHFSNALVALGANIARRHNGIGRKHEEKLEYDTEHVLEH